MIYESAFPFLKMILFLAFLPDSISTLQKNLPNVLCKIKCSEDFRKFQWKAPVLESLFYKFADPRPANLLKRDSNTGAFL